MIIEMEIFLLLLAVTYGGNFFLYGFFKKRKTIQGIEKISIIFGINMLILLLDATLITLAVLAGKG